MHTSLVVQNPDDICGCSRCNKQRYRSGIHFIEKKFELYDVTVLAQDSEERYWQTSSRGSQSSLDSAGADQHVEGMQSVRGLNGT